MIEGSDKNKYISNSHVIKCRSLILKPIFFYFLSDSLIFLSDLFFYVIQKSALELLLVWNHSTLIWVGQILGGENENNFFFLIQGSIFCCKHGYENKVKFSGALESDNQILKP